ncbi:hypothetical protein R1sor_004968 [Riccia sorocarpa]|uniref:F-box domain-containing protein n=1 Tax=Riccia sorocarpa TaxID=122646 RepID=A0ABD3HLQ0_9MARC
MEEAGGGAKVITGLYLQELPQDVLALITSQISPQDVVSLSATCRRLRTACAADEIWLPHCEEIDCQFENPIDYSSWRKGMNSYCALYRFMVSVQSLLGLWLQWNPNLGNLVYITWGFISVVGVRFIKQELGPQGPDGGLMWMPTFEIVARPDGSSVFFLHGRKDHKVDFCCLGNFFPSCVSEVNVLQLGAETLLRKSSVLENSASANILSAVETRKELPVEECISPQLCRSAETRGKKKLFFDQEMLELAATEIGLQVPALLTRSAVFALRNTLQAEKSARTDLIMTPAERRVQLVQSSMKLKEESPEARSQFIHSLVLHARATHLAYNVGIAPYWPLMPRDTGHILYKVPAQKAEKGTDYAGLWAGTFGWPPGYNKEFGRSVWSVLLRYANLPWEQGQVLIATVLQEALVWIDDVPSRNGIGSVMFTAKLDEVSTKPFPWQTERDFQPVNIVDAFQGEGGYQGNQYFSCVRRDHTGAGDLYVHESGKLSFVWKERDFFGRIPVLTLERLDLRKCVVNGERVPAVSPLANFAYTVNSAEKVQFDPQVREVRCHVGIGLGVKVHYTYKITEARKLTHLREFSSCGLGSSEYM